MIEENKVTVLVDHQIPYDHDNYLIKNILSEKGLLEKLDEFVCVLHLRINDMKLKLYGLKFEDFIYFCYIKDQGYIFKNQLWSISNCHYLHYKNLSVIPTKDNYWNISNLFDAEIFDEDDFKIIGRKIENINNQIFITYILDLENFLLGETKYYFSAEVIGDDDLMMQINTIDFIKRKETDINIVLDNCGVLELN